MPEPVSPPFLCKKRLMMKDPAERAAKLIEDFATKMSKCDSSAKCCYKMWKTAEDLCHGKLKLHIQKIKAR